MSTVMNEEASEVPVFACCSVGIGRWFWVAWESESSAYEVSVELGICAWEWGRGKRWRRGKSQEEEIEYLRDLLCVLILLLELVSIILGLGLSLELGSSEKWRSVTVMESDTFFLYILLFNY